MVRPSQAARPRRRTRVAGRTGGPEADGPPRSSHWQAFYGVIARIPPGAVATYGQIAVLAGYRGQARQVGYALAATPEHLDLPWHRVINAQGRVSPRAHSRFHEYQEELLRQEGVELVRGRIDLARYRWDPEPDDA